jgi:hypothetical protein
MNGYFTRLCLRGRFQSKSKSKLLYDSWSVSMSWCRARSGTCDHILLPVVTLLSESCGLVSVGPLSDERTGL